MCVFLCFSYISDMCISFSLCFSICELADIPHPCGKQRTACRSWLSSSTVGFSDRTRVIGLALGILFFQNVWLHLLLATQGRGYQLLAREPPEGAAEWDGYTDGQGSEQGVLWVVGDLDLGCAVTNASGSDIPTPFAEGRCQLLSLWRMPPYTHWTSGNLRHPYLALPMVSREGLLGGPEGAKWTSGEILPIFIVSTWAHTSAPPL